MALLPAQTPSQSHTTPNPRPSHQPPPPRARRSYLGTFTPRTVAAPIAAFTMAIVLYAYSVTSIRAAKRNAALHRQADGGQLDMRRESLRRHGVMDQVGGTKGYELFRDARAEVQSAEGGDSRKEDKVVEGKVTRQVVQYDVDGRARTEVEDELQAWKGKEGVDRRREGAPPGKG